MQHTEFIMQVQNRAKLDNPQDATRYTEVVVSTLAEPLTREITNRLASQLPKPLKELLAGQHAEPLEGVRRYNAEEFVNRVKGRLDLSYQEGEEAAQTVLSVLAEAIDDGLLDEVKRDLPDDYRRLFTH